MSDEYFTQIKNELVRSSKLTPKERSVLFVLISYSNYDEIFISQKVLAKESGMKRKAVIEAVKGLRKKKLLKTTVKLDRSTLIYELASSVVVPKADNVVSKTDKGCLKMTQGVVSKTDTKNINIKNKKLDIILPDWLDKKAWLKFVQHRKEIKKKLTPKAVKMQLKFLAQHKDDHVEIINLAIRNSHTGLYPLKKTGASQYNGNTKEENDELENYIKSTE